MIIGAHAIIYSTNPEADRAFLRDVLEFPHVDVGDGWLIFALPPAEVAVHPADANDTHELYLMCEDVTALIAQMTRHGIACTEAQSVGWGVRTQVTLPGGGGLGIYQPRHARPPQADATTAARTPARRGHATTRKPARRKKRTAGKKAAGKKTASRKKASRKTGKTRTRARRRTR